MRLNDISSIPLYNAIVSLRPEIIAKAQSLYDEWDNSSGDGLCDEISNAIGEILASVGIDTTDGGHDGDDHAYTIAYDDNYSFIVDIPHSIYEQGGGYMWTKIEGVIFEIDDVLIEPCYRLDWI